MDKNYKFHQSYSFNFCAQAVLDAPNSYTA